MWMVTCGYWWWQPSQCVGTGGSCLLSTLYPPGHRSRKKPKGFLKRLAARFIRGAEAWVFTARQQSRRKVMFQSCLLFCSRLGGPCTGPQSLPQTCSMSRALPPDIFKHVKLGPLCTGPCSPPPQHIQTFTTKHGLLESRRLAFDWNTFLLLSQGRIQYSP